MEFRIADTFTDSLARLTAEEQKAVKTTAFDLQVNPAARALNLPSRCLSPTAIFKRPPSLLLSVRAHDTPQ
jgi:hypothetical protein